MFLHIGNGETVRRKDVIGIFDMDTATVSSLTRATLKKYEKEGFGNRNGLSNCIQLFYCVRARGE